MRKYDLKIRTMSIFHIGRHTEVLLHTRTYDNDLDASVMFVREWKTTT